MGKTWTTGPWKYRCQCSLPVSDIIIMHKTWTFCSWKYPVIMSFTKIKFSETTLRKSLNSDHVLCYLSFKYVWFQIESVKISKHLQLCEENIYFFNGTIWMIVSTWSSYSNMCFSVSCLDEIGIRGYWDGHEEKLKI